MPAQQCRPLNTCVYAHWLHSEKYSHCQAKVSEFNVTAVDAPARRQMRNCRNFCTRISEKSRQREKRFYTNLTARKCNRACLQKEFSGNFPPGRYRSNICHSMCVFRYKFKKNNYHGLKVNYFKNHYFIIRVRDNDYRQYQQFFLDITISIARFD